MDDTLLDGVTAMTAAWQVVCDDAARSVGCDAERLRLAIRSEGAKFWEDEAAVGHWRLDLEGARVVVVERALKSEGLDPSLGRQIALRYARQHRENLQLFEDAVQTLECLRSAGYKLGLLTNGPKAMQRDKIERFGIEPYFDVIVIEGEFGDGKPHERVFHHALDVTGATPDAAWHVGDNLYADIGGAKAAGLQAVWITRDRLTMKERTPAVPDRVIGHLPELCQALGV